MWKVCDRYFAERWCEKKRICGIVMRENNQIGLVLELGLVLGLVPSSNYVLFFLYSAKCPSQVFRILHFTPARKTKSVSVLVFVGSVLWECYLPSFSCSCSWFLLFVFVRSYYDGQSATNDAQRSQLDKFFEKYVTSGNCTMCTWIMQCSLLQIARALTLMPLHVTSPKYIGLINLTSAVNLHSFWKDEWVKFGGMTSEEIDGQNMSLYAVRQDILMHETEQI